MTHRPVGCDRAVARLPLAALAAAGAVLVWAYGTTLAEMSERWSSDPQYSHGYLVPVFALALLWLRRGRLDGIRLVPSWWGAPILLAGIALRLVGVYFFFECLDPLSLVPCVAGLVVLVGGWTAWRWAWPAVGFLLFMVPLPFSLSVALTEPLQRLATLGSTFCLQTLGLPAIAEGNVILINDIELNIVEACSGLRMLVIFFALSTAVALLARRRLGEKLVIVASAVPIALVVNVLRITLTGVLYEAAGSETARHFSHDLAGWLMMPIALIFLGIELWVLRRLLSANAVPSEAVVELPTTNPLPRRERRFRTMAPPPQAVEA
jgi:exosortase